MLSRWRHEFNTARVLYRQFLFRIVELESLSSKADVAKLLGQFASVLVLFSLIQMFAGLLFTDAKMTAAVRSAATWSTEYQLLSLTLLVAGLFSVLSWEALLPDQRDAFVLGPLPVQPVTLCLAKVIASASAVGLSAFALNCASGLIWPAALAQAGLIAVLRSYVAYWLTLLCAVLFSVQCGSRSAKRFRPRLAKIYFPTSLRCSPDHSVRGYARVFLLRAGDARVLVSALLLYCCVLPDARNSTGRPQPGGDPWLDPAGGEHFRSDCV